MATKQHYLQQLSTLSVLLLISATAALGQSTSILSIVPTARNTEMGRLEFWGKNTPRSRMQISGAETIASNFAWILPGALPTVNSTLLVSTAGAVTYGAGPNAFVQTTGDQSPINGVKSWYGAQRWFDTNYLRNISTSRDIMVQGIGGMYWLRGADGAGAMGNPIRASIWQYTGLGAEGGSISVHTGNAGAETTTASMSINGVDTSVGYNINGGRVIDSDGSADFTSITVGGNLEVNPSAVLGMVPGGQRFAIGGFDGVGPVASYGGRLRLYNVDGVTSKFGVGHANGALADALNGYAVGGSTVIDSGRNGYLTSLTASGASVISGVTLSSGSIIGNNLNVNSSMVAASGFVNSLTINAGAAIGQCWTATSTGGAGSWQACGVGAFVTTDTIQAITARKDFQGPVVLENTFKIYPNTVDPLWMNFVYPRMTVTRGVTGANAKRMELSTNNGFFGDQVDFSLWTGAVGSETLLVGIGASGVTNFAGYFANGSPGITLTCSVTQTVRGPSYVFGILIAGTCGI